MKYRRTDTVTETKLLLVKTKKDSTRLDHCGKCAEIRLSLTPALAAELLRSTERHILRLIKAGTVHLTGVDNGDPKVCSQSLMRILNERSSTPLTAVFENPDAQ